MPDLHKLPFKLKPLFGLKLSPAIKHTLEKLSIFLIPIPLLFLIWGTEGIIKTSSPESLGSIKSLSLSFFSYFELHTLIIMGALGITFIVWLLTRNMWRR